MLRIMREMYEFSNQMKKLETNTDMNMDEFIKECRTIGEKLGIVTENIKKEYDFKFCQMCFESPAIKGESLCAECKKTNSDTNPNE